MTGQLRFGWIVRRESKRVAVSSGTEQHNFITYEIYK